MSNEYNNEDVCVMCHRPASIAGKMVKLLGGMCICQECMQKAMDSVNAMDFSKMPTGDMNAMMNMFSGMQPTQGSAMPEEKPIQNDNTVISEVEEPSKEDGQNPDGEKTEKKDGPNINFINLADIFGGFPGLGGMMPGKANVKKRKAGEEAEPIISLKDVPPPHIIKQRLDEYVIGQEQAKKVISVAVYNHYKRVATGTMEDIEIEKSNMLLLGPTGCGKTYLVKTLAKLLDVPLAIADATSLTEAGYIGDDIESVLSKLLAAADNDVDRAECGIVFIDEIDKIAKKKNTNSRDVSGESVQQGLLKLLEGAVVEVPIGAGSKNAMVPMTTMDTRNILFICGGAFPRLDEIIRQRLSKQTGIGFHAELKDKLDKDKDIFKKVTTEDIRKYGMIPEFIGRLPVICPLEQLSEQALVQILREPKNAILKQYQKLLELDEVQLLFDDGALSAIAKKALEKETGARALRSIIEEFMLDIMYEIPKDNNIGRVTITKEYIEGTGGPIIDIRSNSTALIDELNEIKEPTGNEAE